MQTPNHPNAIFYTEEYFFIDAKSQPVMRGAVVEKCLAAKTEA